MNKIDINNREVWLIPDNENLEIDAKSAAEFIFNFRTLQLMSDLPIIIHMYCNGGSVDDGMAIYDNIKLSSCPITMIAHNGAASMAGVILQSVKPIGSRILLPNSHFMIHAGSLSLGETTPSAANSYMKYQSKVDDHIMDIYIEQCLFGKKFNGWTKKRIKNFLQKTMDKQQDVYLTPEEAVDYGLCDIVASKEDLNKKLTKLKAGY